MYKKSVPSPSSWSKSDGTVITIDTILFSNDYRGVAWYAQQVQRLGYWRPDADNEAFARLYDINFIVHLGDITHPYFFLEVAINILSWSKTNKNRKIPRLSCKDS